MAVEMLKLPEYLRCTLHNAAGHAGEFRHMYAETVLAPSTREFAQEHHFAVDLLYRDIEIHHAGI